MKKASILIIFTIFSTALMLGQVKLSSVAKIGYQTRSKRVGVGLDGRYAFENDIRLAPEIIFFIPKDNITGLDINLDIHYLFPLSPIVDVYPLVGLAFDNNYYRETRTGETYFGANLGAGVDYDISKSRYLNAQMRYTFNKYKYWFFNIGYGFKF